MVLSEEGGGMRRISSVLVICCVVVGMMCTGCEKKSDTEKAMEGMKKDLSAMTK